MHRPGSLTDCSVPVRPPVAAVSVMRTARRLPMRHPAVAAAALAVLLYAALLAPSLTGRAVLAPTDMLISAGLVGASPSWQQRVDRAANELLFDPVLVFLPWMHFAADELHHGRLPLWNPYIFCGAPFLAANQSALFSPFRWLFFAVPVPGTLAWLQLPKAAVAAAGACVALVALGVRRWLAMLLGAAYPLAGFHFAWLLYPLSDTAVWLPWVFVTTHRCVVRPDVKASLGLAAATALCCLAGHLETAAQILLGSGLYALALALVCCVRGRPARAVLVAGLSLAAGYGLGLAAAAPQILPTAEYLLRSQRVALRAERLIEQGLREPHRWTEVLRMIEPYAFGSRQRGSHELVEICFNEGGVNGYVGATALLILAPLGLAQRRRRRYALALAIAGLIAAAPALRLPVLRAVEQLPPLNAMNNARWLLVTGWAVLSLAALGLEAVLARDRNVQAVCWLVAAVGTAVGIFGLLVVMAPPPRVVHLFTAEAWPWFRVYFAAAAAVVLIGGVLCGVVAWHAAAAPTLRRGRIVTVLVLALALLLLVELCYHAGGYNPQVSPATYYPETALTAELRRLVDRDSRVLGLAGALAPNIGMMYGLRDVRGYDAVDPLPYVELLAAANPKSPARSYAVTLRYWSGPHPILDALAVRWVVSPVRLRTDHWYEHGRFADLWLYENLDAMPRVYVPARARVEPLPERRLRELGSGTVHPREMVLISENVTLPPGPYRGSARLVRDEPCAVDIEVRMERPGVVVLADGWDPGWRVSIDGIPARPLQANHALRAVVVPAGVHLVSWRYRPASVVAGFGIGVGAWLVLGAMTLMLGKRRRDSV